MIETGEKENVTIHTSTARPFRGSSSKWTGINSKIEKQPVEAIHEDEPSSCTTRESSFSPSIFIELKQPVKPIENT